MNTALSMTLPLPQEIYENSLYEYLLIANPGAEVAEKVIAEKQQFYEEYGVDGPIKTKPHVTVAGFLAKEAMEETIIRWIQRICNHQKSFMVTLNNYSGFPAHSIYLRVQNTAPFQNLARELTVVSNYISSCACPPMKLVTSPYMSIAKRLPQEIFFKALTQYARKSFHESFVVNELLLLRRKHAFDCCKPVNVFGLQCGEHLSLN